MEAASGPTRSTCYGDSCSRPAFSVGGARNVLTWLMFGLAVWLSVGVLMAQLLFGADEDDRDTTGR